MPSDQRFAQHHRLRRRADFERVLAHRCAAADELLVVHIAPNGLPWSRLGLSVGKRIGNAVRRNCVRRSIREAFRVGRAEIPPGYDIVCIARPKAHEARREIAGSFHALVARAVRVDSAGKTRSKHQRDSHKLGS